MNKITFENATSFSWLKRNIFILGLYCLITAANIGIVCGQEQSKVNENNSADSAKMRLAHAIDIIPTLVSDGVLSQDQGNELLIKLKVKLADLYLVPSTSGFVAPPMAKAMDSRSAATAQNSVPQLSTLQSTVSDAFASEAGILASTTHSAVTPIAAPEYTNGKESGGKAKTTDKNATQRFEANFVLGAEQSGYSAQVNNTNFFLNAFFRDRFWRPDEEGFGPLGTWGRVRLLSAPQPSTEGIVSTLADPTGKITQSSFTKVGQVADFVIGPEIQIKWWRDAGTRLSFVAGVGATTLLSSDTTVLTYNAPPPKTVECQELVNRFGQNSGYVPYVTADPTQATCIYNPLTNKPYNYLAFSNQDRSNFLSKWGMGFRLEHLFPAQPEGVDSLGTLDLGVGQDQTVTGGKLSGWVFKLDGIYPLTFTKSFIYVFGSATMRIMPNKDFAPLILTVPQGSSAPTIPSESVIVLPLKQPNRDFYRIGVGLNLLDVFCKLKPAGCAKADADTRPDVSGTQRGNEKPLGPTAGGQKPSQRNGH